MIISAVSDQWLFLGVGYYAVYCWAASLRSRDKPTFALTVGSPAFVCTVLGYGCVAFIAYAGAYWTAPYAERVFDVSKSELGLLIGAPSAVGGFLGVIGGGFMADALIKRFAAGRLFVVMFGLLAPIPLFVIQFTTDNLLLFYILAFTTGLLTSSALGAAAASSQALVLPRMRGTATAAFFLATTLLGLALGPFTAGYVSATNGGDLGQGMLTVLWIAPIGFAILVAAIKLAPKANASVVERAQAAGEPV